MLHRPGSEALIQVRRFTTILLTLTLGEALVTTCIHGVAGLTGARSVVVTTRPRRAPRHFFQSDVTLSPCQP